MCSAAKEKQLHFQVLREQEKVYITFQRGVDYITLNLRDVYHHLNFSKLVKLPPKSVLKNHNKSQKNHTVENPIMLDLE
jgi:hypothetical protein